MDADPISSSSHGRNDRSQRAAGQNPLPGDKGGLPTAWAEYLDVDFVHRLWCLEHAMYDPATINKAKCQVENSHSEINKEAG